MFLVYLTGPKNRSAYHTDQSAIDTVRPNNSES